MRGEERGLNFAPLLKHKKRPNHQRSAAFRPEDFFQGPLSLKQWLRALQLSTSKTEHCGAGEARDAQPSFNSTLSDSKEAEHPMKRRIVKALALIAFAMLTSAIAFGQVTSSLSGAVTDPNGAVVAGATVTVKNVASGSEFKTVTSNQGTYNVPSLGAGKYIVVVTASGFKSATAQGIEIDAGTPAAVNVTLEVGQANETVVVQGGSEMVQTQTANVSTTLNANQIINLPLVSRNPVNFVSTMAGVNTPRDVRNSTINGLPESAIDITLDGINVQDNFNKTTDGLFVRVAPTLDTIEEVTVSTSNPEAVGGAMGAVQIKFVTRSGGNEFHGSLYEYHRNTALNSAYWFTNRDTTPYNVEAAKLCDGVQAPFDPDKCHAPRAANLFNQFGGRVGGPIRIPGLFDG